ncbi:hypothetical protein PRIPAC_70260 [Pristionchus pacificus]|uniref:BED-type domain-containing protein n=1 Tax=Pristionchus pacificus TaxID=54126 RepID=A0A2A6BFE5_PRIPA|nr:hypothetical protein PRIPAC_70260 [Pristionchus pacificus]|eukprot:PDM64583.1 hypothetical protein PRIPAC_52839 [Pristionchus pacificus]
MGSLVWKFFTKTINDKGTAVAQCSACSKVFLRREGNTTAMWRHLTRYLPELHAKEKSKEEQNFLKLVAEWVVCSNQSFSIVENPSFLKMMGYSSRYKTPTKYVLTKKILPELEKETKDKIKLILKDQRPSLTADVWESGDVALVSITAHFIDAEFTPRNAILGAKILQYAYTADNIRSVIDECLLEYGVSETAAAVTTDAAATMTATILLDEFRKERIADEHVLQLKKAVKLLGEFYFHTMNLSQDFTPATEIIPIFSELVSFCDSFIASSTGEVVDLAISLRTNLRSRLMKYTSDVNLLSLMTLDPRFARDTQLIPSFMHDEIKEKLIDWFKPNCISGPPTRPVNGASNKFKRLIAERDTQQSPSLHSSDLNDELERYTAELTLNKVRMDANPMDWWRAHQFVFPALALAAREALALQATSVQSERLFSKIGLLYQNKLRNRLHWKIPRDAH